MKQETNEVGISKEMKKVFKRIMDGKNFGTVVGKGRTRSCSCSGDEGCMDCHKRMDYIIIELKHDGGHITVYDHFEKGHAVNFDSSVDFLDEVELRAVSNEGARWVKTHSLPDFCL